MPTPVRTLPALILSLGLLAVLPGHGGAGGIDQSGQPVTALFGEGRHLELLWGRWLPQVSGSWPGGFDSGNAYGPLAGAGAALRLPLGPRLTAAVILDRPYGIVVDYPDRTGPVPYAGTSAEPRSLGLTGLLNWRLAHGFSLHGGVRATRFGSSVHLGGPGFGPISGYGWEAGDDWGIGYVAGAAFEKPEIGLRVALTYGSGMRLDLEGTETAPGLPPMPGETPIDLPQSVNLDMQTGIRADTLLYGSVRWVDWGGWEAAPRAFVAMTGAPLVRFSHDSLTWRAGIGHRFGARWSGSLEIAHETATGEAQTALTPYDGYTAFGAGAAYTLPSGVEIAAGAAWYALGDADVATPMGPGRFHDNHALGLGLKLSYDF